MSEPSLALQLAHYNPPRAILVVRDEASFACVARFLRFVLPHHKVLVFEPMDGLSEDGGCSLPVRGRQLDTLYTRQQTPSDEPVIVITTAEAALEPLQTPNPDGSVTLSIGDDVPHILDTLVKCGYNRAGTAYDIGDYAPRVRGVWNTVRSRPDGVRKRPDGLRR